MQCTTQGALENERLQLQLATRNDELQGVCYERDQLREENTEFQARYRPRK